MKTLMDDLRLMITETSDDHIKIAGVISDAPWVKNVAGISADKGARPIELPLDKAAAYFEGTITHAIVRGMLKGNTVMFKEPITIKSASAEKPAIVIDDRGLSDALRQASENALTKSAKNAFCDDLIAAIEDAKVDAQGALNLSMPLKIEFRDEATKQAFMGLGRRNKLKKVAASIASLGRANLLDAMAQKLAMCAKKKGKKRGYGKKKRGVK